MLHKTNFERINRENVINISLNDKINVQFTKTLNEALNITKLNNTDLMISKLDYQIAEREANIEKARLSPSASIKLF